MEEEVKPKALVTGHLGFIASGFCAIARERFDLVGVDHLGWGALTENLAPGVVDVRGDIGDAALLKRVFEEHRPVAVFNFAAESHVDRSIADDLPFWRSNVLGARALALECTARKIRLVQVSTDEVYGDALENDRPWTESSPIAAKNPYAVTKAAAELMLAAYVSSLGLDVVFTRGANTIGARQFPEKAVPKAVTCFLEGRPFPLFKSPARRLWLDVDDHARGVLAAFEKGRAGQAYNIAPDPANEAYTHDVIERVRAIVGRGEIQLVEDRKAYDLRYWMSNDKARAELGWTPQGTLDATIRKTVAWYLANPDWLRRANEKLGRG
jgi:dTDP-glucose 4,6-dehydratase